MPIQFAAKNEHLQLILLSPQSERTIQDAQERVQAKMKEAYPRGNFILKRQMQPPRPA
jgi:hypothetical protein